MAVCLHTIYSRNLFRLMKSSLNTISESVLKRYFSTNFFRLHYNRGFDSTCSIWRRLKYNLEVVSRIPGTLRLKRIGTVSKQFSSGAGSNGISDDALQKEINEISENFTETLGLLEDAKNSLGTIYFTEDMKDAEAMVNVTLNDYNTLLKKLNENQRANVNRTIGLKMHEMKAQLEMIREMCRE